MQSDPNKFPLSEAVVEMVSLYVHYSEAVALGEASGLSHLDTTWTNAERLEFNIQTVVLEVRHFGASKKRYEKVHCNGSTAAP